MILAAETLTVFGLVSGAVVSAGTLGVALRSSRGDGMAKTVEGALELGDRYKTELAEVRADLSALTVKLTECTDLHEAAATELAEVRSMAQRAIDNDATAPLIADAGDAWFTLGIMGELVDCNRGFINLFGLAPNEVMAPGSWRSRVEPGDLAALDATAGHVFAARSPLHTSFRVQVGASLVPVLARAHPLQAAADGSFMGWKGILVPQWDKAVTNDPSAWPAPPPTPWGTFPE